MGASLLGRKDFGSSSRFGNTTVLVRRYGDEEPNLDTATKAWQEKQNESKWSSSVFNRNSERWATSIAMGMGESSQGDKCGE